MPHAPTADSATHAPSGCFVTRDGRTLYEIRNLDRMPPFLMTVVADSDLWMYLSSAGAFTAGRVEPDRSLFPYETDDRLHELGGLMGPITMVRFEDGRVWRPFDRRADAAEFTRTLRRSAVGDLVELEETDTRTGVTFRVRLELSDTFGVIRRAELGLQEGATPTQVELLDGYLNVMPANVPLGLQQTMSTLVDGYKRAQRVPGTTLALYTLEATISDRPEASESLRANAAWHTGLPGATLSLSDAAVEAFERDAPACGEDLVTGRRGAYLLHSSLRLTPDQPLEWCLVGDVHLDHAAVATLRRRLAEPDPMRRVEASLLQGRERLGDLLDNADGAQATGDAAACAAHRSNVLFNAMRGGVPLNGYAVEPEDFRRFVRTRHHTIADRHVAFLAELEAPLTLDTLPERVAEAGDPQLVRLAREYLPLTFGRRHGDPSRPWNRFRIRVRDAAGNRVTGYEGNWRDIFQNWEAVCRSYPAMLPGVIAKFVNASTVDGFNPYRINERGIDWETPEPENPRSNIGYWGDHQIVYLHRLLDQCRDTFPGLLEGMLGRAEFSYAQIPYRLRPFVEIVKNPRHSITFAPDLDARLRTRTNEVGGDARLVCDADGEPVLVTLLEKLVVTTLAKVSCLAPGGGVWMNTQRPEWNDANNALAGHGLSMVTLYQLRSFAETCGELAETIDQHNVPVTGAVAAWCRDTVEALSRWLGQTGPTGAVNDAARWTLLVDLGTLAERARERLYQGVTAPEPMEPALAADLFRLTRELCDQSIASARRPDGLYESYNVLHLGPCRASVEPLQPMLEGQVSVLASGVLGPAQACELLDTLFASELYRPDQKTFMLYPRADLPAFMDKNIIPDGCVAASPLLSWAIGNLDAGLAVRDAEGHARFGAGLISREALAARLETLGRDPDWARVIEQDAGAVWDAFEQTFHHSRFTGRSGTMHKYEGLGSVYWHMVSKLLLATQECVFRAADAGAAPAVVNRLRAHYTRVRNGLGFHKSPLEFGAVPHEAYSHTPWGGGAQQPGMTGQVKEGVLARFGELGVRLHRGTLRFDPLLIDEAEWLAQPTTMSVRGTVDRGVEVPAGSIGFTVCATPIVLSRSDQDRISVRPTRGQPVEINGRTLPAEWCRELFSRSGRIQSVHVALRPRQPE